MTEIDSRSRLNRAQVHRDALEAGIDDAASVNGYGVRRELEDDGAHHVYCAVVDNDLMQDLSVLVSDCLHNLRSSLDNLVFTLATARQAVRGRVLSPEEEMGLAFPISDTANKFAERTPTALLGVSGRARALIEAHQPYGAWNGTKIERSPLWQLRELQNIDKHRCLLGLGVTRGDTSVSSGELDPAAYRYVATAQPHDRLEGGTELCRFIFPQPEPHVDMRYKPTLKVAVYEGPTVLRGAPVLGLLDTIINEIRALLYHAERLPELT